MTKLTLDELRVKYGDADGGIVHDPDFRKIAERIFSPSGQRSFPYSGIPTFLRAPLRPIDWSEPNLEGLEVALLGIPMDLGVTNRNGARFGPRALRAIERIGPYNHVLKCMPTHDLAVADVGDLPLSTRFDLEKSHADIFRHARMLVDAGVKPVSVGGDHSITLPLLNAVAKNGPVGLIHIDAHCDTSGAFEGCKFHHGGPFRRAVLDGHRPDRHSWLVRISVGVLLRFRHDGHPC